MCRKALFAHVCMDRDISFQLVREVLTLNVSLADAREFNRLQKINVTHKQGMYHPEHLGWPLPAFVFFFILLFHGKTASLYKSKARCSIWVVPVLKMSKGLFSDGEDSCWQQAFTLLPLTFSIQVGLMHVACWPVPGLYKTPQHVVFFFNSANQSSVGDTATSVLNPISLACLLNCRQWTCHWAKRVCSKSLQCSSVVEEAWGDLWFLCVQALHISFCLPGRPFPQRSESSVYHNCTLWCCFFCLLVGFMAGGSSPWHCQFDQLATEQWQPESHCCGYGFPLP